MYQHGDAIRNNNLRLIGQLQSIKRRKRGRDQYRCNLQWPQS
jgi:hypothetical protein